MKRPIIRSIAIAIGILSLFAVLLIKSQAIDFPRHNLYVGHIRQLDERDARLNQNILLARYGTLQYYDPINHAIAQPERTRNGTIVWEGIVIDISDRKQVEAELRYSQQCLARLIEQSPVGILEWNQDCEITQWNPAAEQIFGYPQSEIIGRHFKLIVPPELHEYVDGVSTDILAQSGGTVSINENVTKAGETITCEWHNNPLVDVNGDVVGAASMGVSIRFSDFGYNPGRGEIAAVGPCSQLDPSLLTCKMKGVGYGKYLAASLIAIDSPVTLTLITTGEKGEEDSDGKLSIKDFWEPDSSAYLYKSNCQ